MNNVSKFFGKLIISTGRRNSSTPLLQRETVLRRNLRLEPNSTDSEEFVKLCTDINEVKNRDRNFISNMLKNYDEYGKKK